MSLLQNLQTMLGQNLQGLKGNKALSGLGDLLNPTSSSGIFGPAALGGLLGALLTSKAVRGVAGGALLAGGAATLWNKYKNGFSSSGTEADATQDSDHGGAPSGTSPYPGTPAPLQDQAVRLVRALVYAAKSDGHIADAERAAVYENIKKLNLGADGEALVRQALEEPLDPARVAEGVASEQEALQLYMLSCSIAGIDHFMERSYLDALAAALKIPPDVQADVEAKLHAPVQG